jgi:hypothetical protein
MTVNLKRAVKGIPPLLKLQHIDFSIVLLSEKLSPDRKKSRPDCTDTQSTKKD